MREENARTVSSFRHLTATTLPHTTMATTIPAIAALLDPLLGTAFKPLVVDTLTGAVELAQLILSGVLGLVALKSLADGRKAVKAAQEQADVSRQQFAQASLMHAVEMSARYATGLRALNRTDRILTHFDEASSTAERHSTAEALTTAVRDGSQIHLRIKDTKIGSRIDAAYTYMMVLQGELANSLRYFDSVRADQRLVELIEAESENWGSPKTVLAASRFTALLTVVAEQADTARTHQLSSDWLTSVEGKLVMFSDLLPQLETRSKELRSAIADERQRLERSLEIMSAQLALPRPPEAPAEPEAAARQPSAATPR